MNGMVFFASQTKMEVMMFRQMSTLYFVDSMHLRSGVILTDVEDMKDFLLR